MSPSDLPVGPADVEEAAGRIADVSVVSPLVPAPGLRARVGAPVSLKLESVQPTGSFKVRGAASRLARLGAGAARRGVVTASTGNHGRAVAYVARDLGMPATVCVSEHVPAGKVRALEALGCVVQVGGRSQTEGLATAAELVTTREMTLVHPFDDPDVIAGQGTVGLEIAGQAPDTATVLVPLSGGGLLSGIAVAATAVMPAARVVGVSMERAAAMAASLRHGAPVELDEQHSLADSLQGGIGAHNRCTFAITRALVDEVVLVTEQHIWDAMRLLFDEHRLIVEGAGAVGVAALLSGRVVPHGHTVAVVSGANAEDGQVEALARGDDAPP